MTTFHDVGMTIEPTPFLARRFVGRIFVGRSS